MTPHVRRCALSVIIAGAAIALSSRPAAAAECHGVRMPDRIEVGGKTLVLNGMGTREATVLNVDVYVAGLYLEQPSRYGSRVLQEMGTTRIALKLLRDVERGEMSEALREGLERNAGGHMSELAERADRLEQLIPDLNRGDTVTFTYSPEAGALALHVNGQPRGSIRGADFARTFFAIWLGTPPNPELKRGLLGGECG